MLIKKLYEDYDLSIDSIIFREYKRLDLTMTEMNILITLLMTHKKRRVFSLRAITRRTSLSDNEVYENLQSLIDKNFVLIELEQTKDNKHREVINLDPTFDKIEDMLVEEERQKQATMLEKIIQTLEEKMQRILRPMELQQIQMWLESEGHTAKDISDAIELAKDNVTIKRIERFLTFKNEELEKPKPLDKDKQEALDRLRKRIK